MRNLSALGLLLCSTLAVAKPPPDPLTLDAISESDVPLVGSQCSFSDGSKSVLLSDGVAKLWVRSGGALHELVLVGDPATTVEASGRGDGVGDRWHPTFSSDWGTVTLDVKTTAVGEADTSARRGTVTVRQGTRVWKIRVEGGCAA